jgi:hypothetical protein
MYPVFLLFVMTVSIFTTVITHYHRRATGYSCYTTNVPTSVRVKTLSTNVILLVHHERARRLVQHQRRTRSHLVTSFRILSGARGAEEVTRNTACGVRFQKFQPKFLHQSSNVSQALVRFLLVFLAALSPAWTWTWTWTARCLAAFSLREPLSRRRFACTWDTTMSAETIDLCTQHDTRAHKARWLRLHRTRSSRDISRTARRSRRSHACGG